MIQERSISIKSCPPRLCANEQMYQLYNSTTVSVTKITQHTPYSSIFDKFSTFYTCCCLQVTKPAVLQSQIMLFDYNYLKGIFVTSLKAVSKLWLKGNF